MPENLTTTEVIKTVESAEEVLGPPKAEVPSWKKILKGLAYAIWIGFVGAVSQVLTDHSGEVAMLLIALVPTSLKGYAGAVIGSAVAALAAYVKKRSDTKKLEEKRDALATLPPPDLAKYY